MERASTVADQSNVSNDVSGIAAAAAIAVPVLALFAGCSADGGARVVVAPIATGAPTTSHAAVPASTPGPGSDGVTLAATDTATCARFGARTCCWGDSLAAPTPVVLPGPPTDLAVLITSACAVVAHAVWCWPLQTGVQPSASALAGAERVSRISAAGPHACALRDDGRVVCWGASIFGEVGNGTIGRGPLPPSDVGLSDVVELAAGEWHQCARRRSGSVACWGMGYEGSQCSNYMCSAVPVDVPLPAPATQIAAGGIETCARLADGTSYCWKVEDGKQTAPAPNAKVPPGAAIHPGYKLGCALPPDHRPICWGGLGHNERLLTVDYAPIAGLDHVAEHASGFYHACIRGEDGAVRCFGANDSHQLGDGTTVDAPSPGAPVRCGD
jgi:hypothetical protein